LQPRRDADPSPPSSAEVIKQDGAIPLLSLRAFVAYERVKHTVLVFGYKLMSFMPLTKCSLNV